MSKMMFVVRPPGEFANPWHDILGRFAPKGMGRTTGFDDGRARRLRDDAEETVESNMELLEQPYKVSYEGDKERGTTFQQTVEEYLGYASPEVDEELRAHGADKAANPRHRQALVDAIVIDEAIRRGGYTFPEDTVLLRGVRNTSAQQLTPGAKFRDDGFLSVTAAEGEAAQDARSGGNPGTLVAVQIPAGTRALPGNDLEQEFILPRGGTYRVVSVDDGVATVKASFPSSPPKPSGLPTINDMVGEVAAQRRRRDEMLGLAASLGGNDLAPAAESAFQKRIMWDLSLFEIEIDPTIEIDEPDVRSYTVAEFANPWHDENGRFAPKGMGSTAPAAPETGQGGRTTGVDAAALAAEVAAGRPVKVDPVDVDDVLVAMAGQKDMDLTLVTVEGSPSMFSQMRGNGMPRSAMPQIPPDKLAEFQAYLTEQGITFRPGRTDPAALKATQSELNGGKVGGMVQSLRDGTMTLEGDPIWKSNDNHVLDGHHRWASSAAISADQGGGVTIPTMDVDAPMSQLLSLANTFVDQAGIPRQGVNEPSRIVDKDKQAASVARFADNGQVAPETYGMATDAADGITDEDLANLPHGDGSFFADAEPAAEEEPAADAKPVQQATIKQWRVKGLHAEFGNPWHDEIGRFAPKGTGSRSIPGVGDVDAYLAATPQLPGEAIFVWHGRLVDGLPPEAKHALLFEIRERYEPVDYIADGMKQWREMNGLPEPQVVIGDVPANQLKSDTVARVFEEIPDMADNPEVQAAFEEFKVQNEQMWDFMTAPVEEGGLGIKVEFWTNDDPTQFGVGPYADATAQAEDLRVNRRIVLEAGLGGKHDATMTQDEYDRFRAVHDVFGHAGIGSGFDRHGEYQAYLAHSSMYTGLAREAMASEYHGVNSAAWAGEPGSPGTGKSVLLPDLLTQNPWDEYGNLRPLPTPEELAPFIPADDDYDYLTASGAMNDGLLIDEDTAEGIIYLVRRAGIHHPFAQMYDDSGFHNVEQLADTEVEVEDDEMLFPPRGFRLVPPGQQGNWLTTDDVRAAYHAAYGDRDANEVLAEVMAAQEALLASAGSAEFANPWHDERGRFAPKGSGRAFAPADVVIRDESGGIIVSEQARILAREIRANAEAIEPTLTAELAEMIGDSNPESYEGGDNDLYGFEYRLKGEAQIASKIERNIEEKGYSRIEAAQKINDAVRYTVHFDEASFGPRAQAVIDQLRAENADVRVKNTWPPDLNSPYKGVNVAITRHDGTRWELQFHTPKSQSVKDALHSIYERQRELPKGSPEYVSMQAEMIQIASDLMPPTGAVEVFTASRILVWKVT